MEEKFGTKITKEMGTNEHPIPSDVIIGNANSNKKLNRNSGEGAVLSKQAPAYYENASLHSAHVGTGSSRKSRECRREVNRLMLEGDIEGAMILNIRNYMAACQNLTNFTIWILIIVNLLTNYTEVYHDSFLNMLQQDPEFEMYTSTDIQTLSLNSDLSNQIQINLIIARYEAYNGNNPIESVPVMERMVHDIQNVTGNYQFTLDDLQNTMNN